MKKKLNTTFDENLLNAFEAKAKAEGYKKINSAIEFLMTKFLEDKKMENKSSQYIIGKIVAIYAYDLKKDLNKAMGDYLNQPLKAWQNLIIRNTGSISKNADNLVTPLFAELTTETIPHAGLAISEIEKSDFTLGFYHQKSKLLY